ncbi:MAG: hypothetical protein AAGL89_12275 [Pseudomonadota bacterium]
MRLLTSKAGWAVGGLVLSAVWIFGLIQYGQSIQKANQAAENAQHYIEGTKDARDALNDLPDNAVDGLRSLPF